MIEHAWTVLCTNCIVDSQTNNATLSAVIEQLSFAPPAGQQINYPVVVPMQLDLVSVWYRSDASQGEAGTARISFVQGNNVLFGPTEFAVDLTQFFRARVITRMAGLPLNASGVYFFRVELRGAANQWREVAKVPLVFTIQQAPN